MAGLNLNMGLGTAGSYRGPVYGSDGPSAVPAAQGYPDTGNAALMFGPGTVSGGGSRNPAGHGLVFGLLCLAGLIVIAWALPR